MKGGRVEFNMPKARVELVPGRSIIDVHVWWACAAMATLLAGIALGRYLEREASQPLACHHSLLNEGIVAPAGAAQCTYLTPSPIPRKGKHT